MKGFKELNQIELRDTNGGESFWYNVGYFVGQMADRWADAMFKLAKS